MPTRTLAFVGSLTRPAGYFPTATGRGITVMEFDEASGRLTPLAETTGIDNPGYLAIDPTGRFLYSVSEVAGWHEGTVTAYRIEPDSGTLTYINKQPTLGSACAHVSLDRTGRWLLAANYRDGPDGARPPKALVVYPLDPDGGIGAPVSSASHSGNGPHDRQDGPHPHCTQISPDNRHILVADLGTDHVMVHAFDATSGTLSPAARPSARLEPGSGPRHLAFHPSAKFLYVINELANTIAAMAWSAETGGLDAIQTISTLPSGYADVAYCSDIQVSSDGKFLYGANRGPDSIFCAAIDPASGRLAPIGTHSTIGSWPRQISFDPTERFLLVANQNGNIVTVLARDPGTGLLSDSGHHVMLGTPMCVKFARYP